MSIGQRLKAFLDSNQHSLRDAEGISGVSRATIGRICQGYMGPTVEAHVRQIVAGYRKANYAVDEQEILEGRSPRGDFEGMIGQAKAGQRLSYIAMSIQQRIRLTVAFMNQNHPTCCEPGRLGAACALTPEQVATHLRIGEAGRLDTSTALALAQGIHRITGIGMNWFRFGWLDSEDPVLAFTERTSRACLGGRTKPATTKAVLEIVQQTVKAG